MPNPEGRPSYRVRGFEGDQSQFKRLVEKEIAIRE